MTREELVKFIESKLPEVLDLFKRKNRSYGDSADAFHNFRETARRVLKVPNWDQPEAMFRALLVLFDKHYVALCNNGLRDPDLEERLRDIIVYCLIGMAMAKEAQKYGCSSHASGAGASAAEAN